MKGTELSVQVRLIVSFYFQALSFFLPNRIRTGISDKSLFVRKRLLLFILLLSSLLKTVDIVIKIVKEICQ